MADLIEKWVRQAQTGDKEAFIQLVESQKLSLTRAALAILHNQEDAADAVAETVLEAFCHLRDLRQPKYFRTWLMRVLINNSRDILRQRSRTLPLDQAPEPVADPPGDLSLDVQESLAALHDNDRLVLTLFYLDGLPVRDIARMLELKEGAVKSRLKRGRDRLKKIYLEREGENYEATSPCHGP